MEIRITTQQILKILYVVSWIIFIGLCVEAGSYVFNAIFTLIINPEITTSFGLASLYEFDPGYFVVMLLLMSIVAGMKALMFYLIVKILHDKKLNLVQPFNKEVGRFIFSLSYLALAIGMFSYWGVKFSEWFVSQGVQMPEIQSLQIGGADVWLFMGAVLYIIAQIFKRGIEIQIENELTI